MRRAPWIKAHTDVLHLDHSSGDDNMQEGCSVRRVPEERTRPAPHGRRIHEACFHLTTVGFDSCLFGKNKLVFGRVV